MTLNRCKVILFIIISTLFVDKTNSQTHPVKSIIQILQQRYAPDKRTAIFKISYRHTKSGLILKGEVDNYEAKSKLIDTITTTLNIKIIDRIRILPDTNLCIYRNGIIFTEIGNIRKKPFETSELVTQTLMGATVKLLDKKENYFLIQTSDKYLGWIIDASLIPINEREMESWNKANKVIVTALTTTVAEEPDINSNIITNVSIGCILKCDSITNEWTSVKLANGKKGYIKNRAIENYDIWKENRSLTAKNIENTARQFLGIPYLWGGTSARGFDCSGFVKMVYYLNGLELNRDADQQSLQGKEIQPGINFSKLKKGDLLFFGQKATLKKKERINHVAIYLDKNLFIHSSGEVKLGSFDPTSKYFDKSLLKKFVRARRLI